MASWVLAISPSTRASKGNFLRTRGESHVLKACLSRSCSWQSQLCQMHQHRCVDTFTARYAAQMFRVHATEMPVSRRRFTANSTTSAFQQGAVGSVLQCRTAACLAHKARPFTKLSTMHQVAFHNCDPNSDAACSHNFSVSGLLPHSCNVIGREFATSFLKISI